MNEFDNEAESTSALAAIIPSLTAGFVSGVIIIALIASFCALIFTGPLAPHMSTGLGLALLGNAAICLIFVFFRSPETVLAHTQDAPAAIMAISAASIVAKMGDADNLLPTIIVSLATVAMCSGIFFFLLGRYRLGRFIRYIPYPVIGGFLGGTGWLLIQGAFGVMCDTPLHFSSLGRLLSSELIQLWGPGALLGTTILLSLRKIDHPLLFPGFVFGAVALFYGGLGVSSMTLKEATEMGLLLGPFPEGSIFTVLKFSDFQQADWAIVGGEWINYITIALIGSLSLLLGTSSIELALDGDMNMDDELKKAGLANMASGACGGLIGYQGMSLSLLSARMKASGEYTSLVIASLCVLTIFVGAQALAYFPKMVLGGLLFFIGLDFLVTWVYDAWFRLPRVEYFLLVFLVAIVAGFGFLEGVAVGVLAATVLFVVNYSRINVVKHKLTGEHFHAMVERSDYNTGLLAEHGKELLILELEGYLFFGTANQLLEMIKTEVTNAQEAAYRHVVFDFGSVIGFDSSVMLCFKKLRQFTSRNKMELVFSNLSPSQKRQLRAAGFAERDASYREFGDLDYAVEWCEDQIIERHRPAEWLTQKLEHPLSRLSMSSAQIEELSQYFEKNTVEAGVKLIEQDGDSEELYFIIAGVVTAVLTLPSGETRRLKSMQEGTVVGEVGFYLGLKRSATIITETPTTYYKMKFEDLMRMREESPSLATDFHISLARVISRRLVESLNTMSALMK